MGQVEQMVECRVLFNAEGTHVVIVVNGEKKVKIPELVAILRQQIAEIVAEHEKQTGELIQ